MLLRPRPQARLLLRPECTEEEWCGWLALSVSQEVEGGHTEGAQSSETCPRSRGPQGGSPQQRVGFFINAPHALRLIVFLKEGLIVF